MEEKNENLNQETEPNAADCGQRAEAACEEPKAQDKKKDKKKHKDAELEKIKALLEKEQQQSADYLNTAQRLQAEFDNFRRRNQTLRADAYQDGKLDTLKELLPVLDNFERAMAAKADADAFFEGVEKIYKQLLETMTKMGVEEIPALGETFDPEKHHAVMQAEATEDYPAGTVCEVFQKGYRAGEKVLRYSMVKVAQ